MAVFLVLVGVAALLWAFTAVETRRIETRYPALGRLVEVDRSNIHVIETPAQGEERGAVLMIHGASGNASDLNVALAGPLSEAGFRVLSVDRPGHGWSDRVPRPDATSPEAQAQALRRAASAMGVERAIVVVHSLGGITGLAMALNAPDFVRALVLIAPVSHPWPGGVAWYYSAGAHPLIGPPLRRLLTLPAGLVFMRGAIASVFAPNAPPPGFIAATRLPLVLRPNHFRANCEDVAAANAAVIALSPRYGTIRAPVEVVAGEGDAVVSNALHARGLERDIPGARVTVLERVGHSPHHVAPERLVSIILDAERRAREREREAV